MKHILFLLLFLNTIAFTQTIYFEDFSNDWKKGAITYGGVSPSQPTDNNWYYVIVGSPDNDGGSASSWNDMAFIDGAAVMSTNGASSSTLAFRWNDVNNGSATNRVDWYSKEMTGNYTGVSFSVDYAIGNGSSANSVYAYYIIDGGTPVLFGSKVNQSTASGTFTISSLSANVSVQIYVKAITRDFNASYVYIDNVTITGATSLPIHLLSFAAEYKYEHDNIEVKWVTASEDNVMKYLVMCSENGTYFYPVDSLLDIGSSSYTRYYRREFEAPRDGTLVYVHLREIDYDGYREDFDIISVPMIKKRKTILGVYNLIGQPASISDSGTLIILYTDGTRELLVK